VIQQGCRHAADQASSGCQAQGPVCSHDAQISKVKYLFFISKYHIIPFSVKVLS